MSGLCYSLSASKGKQQCFPLWIRHLLRAALVLLPSLVDMWSLSLLRLHLVLINKYFFKKPLKSVNFYLRTSTLRADLAPLNFTIILLMVERILKFRDTFCLNKFL